jgi:hypothetical protein
MKKDPTGFKKGPKRYWPSWRYSVAVPEGKVFDKPEDVPEGWFPTLAEAQAYEKAQALPAVIAANADPAAKVKKAPKAKEKSADEIRAEKVAKLIKVGYDPEELKVAKDADLDAALKALPNGAD